MQSKNTFETYVYNLCNSIINERLAGPRAHIIFIVVLNLLTPAQLGRNALMQNTGSVVLPQLTNLCYILVSCHDGKRIVNLTLVGVNKFAPQ
jgi:hypothetical protein